MRQAEDRCGLRCCNMKNLSDINLFFGKEMLTCHSRKRRGVITVTALGLPGTLEKSGTIINQWQTQDIGGARAENTV